MEYMASTTDFLLLFRFLLGLKYLWSLVAGPMPNLPSLPGLGLARDSMGLLEEVLASVVLDH